MLFLICLPLLFRNLHQYLRNDLQVPSSNTVISSFCYLYFYYFCASCVNILVATFHFHLILFYFVQTWQAAMKTFFFPVASRLDWPCYFREDHLYFFLLCINSKTKVKLSVKLISEMRDVIHALMMHITCTKSMHCIFSWSKKRSLVKKKLQIEAFGYQSLVNFQLRLLHF